MAGKIGFFQKGDQKKQYSDNVLNNVESAYRPKNRGRARNPISSNTLSGEEPESLEENFELQQQLTQQGRYRNPVGYAFAGPQAKRQKLAAQTEANVSAKNLAKEEEQGDAPSIVFAAPAGLEKTVEPVERQPKKSRKLSQPEIQVRTGNPFQQPEPEAPVQPQAQKQEVLVAKQYDEVLAAMQQLEADVQESKGNYEPIKESEIEVARSLGFKHLFCNRPALRELQYELEFDLISTDEFCTTVIGADGRAVEK
jgi:hypothetical protein